MKKFIYLLLSSLIILSCTKKEEEIPPSNPMLGKWQVTWLIENFQPVTAKTCNPSLDVVEFLEDGNSTLKYASYNYNTKICSQKTKNTTYTIKNDILEVTEKQNGRIIFEIKSKIIEITSKKIKFNTFYLYESNSTGTGGHTSNYKDGEDIFEYTKL